MRAFLFMTVGIAMLASGAPAVAGQAADDDEAAIRVTTETRQGAANAKDVKTYLSFIDEECTAGWDGNPCAGAIRASGEFPEAVINAQARIFEGGDIVFVTPDVAIYRYRANRLSECRRNASTRRHDAACRAAREEGRQVGAGSGWSHATHQLTNCDLKGRA